MTDPVRFEIGDPDQYGKRLVKAFAGGELLDQQRLDVFQQWQAKPFIDRVTGRLPATVGYDSFADAVAFVAGDFDEAIRNLPAVGSTSKASTTLVVVSMDEVQPEPVDWLWDQRIARRKITLLCGIPGLGKTFIGLDVAARCSTGGKYPDSDSHAPLGTSILLTIEDGLADTIAPRLIAAGADLRKIKAIPAVKYTDPDTSEETESAVDLTQHLGQLEELIVSLGDVVLIMVDPLPGFLGQTDAHKNSEVRRALAALAALADKHNIAILGISHLTKDETKAAINRTQGSIAFVAAARCVLAAVGDKDDPTGKRRLLLPIKNNLGNDTTGLAYELTSRYSGGVPCVLWEAGTVDIRADQALSPDARRHGPEPEAQDDAERWLVDALANGPRLAKELIEEAREGQGISKRTLDRAKKELGIVAFRESNTGPWSWKLPEGHIANEVAHKVLGNLGNVEENPRETTDSDPSECHIAKLSVCGNVGTNGHDHDAINRALAEAGEPFDDGVGDQLRDFLGGF